MELNEKVIQHLEEHFPELAATATQQAYWQALAEGSSVLVAHNDQIIEIFPDGTTRAVKSIQPPVMVEKGKKISIR